MTSKQQLINVINLRRQQYIDNGVGQLLIKKTDNFIGWTRLKFVTDLTNNHQNYYDFGYRLIKKYRIKGIATETTITSLIYVFDSDEIPVLQSLN